LIQTIGRAARNANGHVIMYADKITKSMQIALDETERRRKRQIAHNEKYGITPQTIQKAIPELIRATVDAEDGSGTTKEKSVAKMTKKEREKVIEKMEKEMKEAAKNLDFERAAELRDLVLEMKAEG
jgi:excinuclease ABC subunit B